jgi:triphosphoribosyl-dephospho-CoA synthase
VKSLPDAIDARIAAARLAFLRACSLDVAVRKPGNVSAASPGHRMHAGLFLASAQAAAGPLFARGHAVGERIERATEGHLGRGRLQHQPRHRAAVRAAGGGGGARTRTSRAADGAASPCWPDSTSPMPRAAYRAIARPTPADWAAPAQDVAEPPSGRPAPAMALAAPRDRIAQAVRERLRRPVRAARADAWPHCGTPASRPHRRGHEVDRVQRVFLEFLARWPDSHIVRKHGEGPAQTVMTAAQAWRQRPELPEDDPAFAAWDESLKADGLNPGTSADLTVAALLLAQPRARALSVAWIVLA